MPASCLSLSPFAHSVAHVVAGAGSGVGFALTPHFVTSPGGHVHDHEVGARERGSREGGWHYDNTREGQGGTKDGNPKAL